MKVPLHPLFYFKSKIYRFSQISSLYFSLISILCRLLIYRLSVLRVPLFLWNFWCWHCKYVVNPKIDSWSAKSPLLPRCKTRALHDPLRHFWSTKWTTPSLALKLFSLRKRLTPTPGYKPQRLDNMLHLDVKDKDEKMRSARCIYQY